MRLIDDWKTVLARSTAVWCGAIGGALSAAAGMLYVLQGRLDDRLLFGLAVLCGALGPAISFFGVPIARITKQKSISGDDDADASA